jgi:hypothetical protein
MFRNTFRFLSFLSVVTLAVTVAPACATTIQTYTDLASWQAATSPLLWMDFENGSLGNASVQFSGAGGGSLFVQDTSAASWMNFGTGKAAAIIVQSLNPIPSIHVVLNTPVTAFALNAFTANPNALSFTITYNGTSSYTVSTPASGTPAFFGLTSNTAITTIDLTLQGPSQGAYEFVDNFRTGTASAQDTQAPEAATFLLIGSGLIGIMVLRKRIMKNKPDLRRLQNDQVLSAC